MSTDTIQHPYYTTKPLQKLYELDEKTITDVPLISKLQKILSFDADDTSEEEDGNYTSLPLTLKDNTATRVLKRSDSTSSDFDHINYINSIRKTRPLPKVPDRNASKDVSQQEMDSVLNNRLSAREIFQMLKNHDFNNDESEEGEKQQRFLEETVKSDQNCGGVYALKTQIAPAPVLPTQNLHLMTPVQELNEEEFEHDYDYLELPEITSDNELEKMPSQLSASSKGNESSLTSGQTTPISRRSIEEHAEQRISYSNFVISANQQFQAQQQSYNNSPQILHCDTSALYPQPETDCSFPNVHENATQQPHNYYYAGEQEQMKHGSLLMDVQKLVQLNYALMNPRPENNAIPVQQQPSHDMSNTIPIHTYDDPSSYDMTNATVVYGDAESPINVAIDDGDYTNINTKSPLSMTSFSLTHDKELIKTYRRMAEKTPDKHVRFSYATYLIRLVSFYTSSDVNKNLEVRNRLQKEAEHWIEKLAKSGHAESLYIKGQWHRHCCDSPKNVFVGSQYKQVNNTEALKCFQKAAKAGSIESNYDLAEYFIADKKYKKAIDCYRFAASKGHVLSLYRLSNILIRGLLNQPKDIRQGMLFLKNAADSDKPESARSAYDLACIYACELELIDLERNRELVSSIKNQKISPTSVIHYYKKSDELGLPAASFRLGSIFEKGLFGVQPNTWEAYKHYAKAAENKHEAAMIQLSRLYKEGIPGYLRPHPQMAYKWCHRATENGNEEAEYVLGTYYESGVGVLPDYSMALEWFSKSASKGCSLAEDKLNITNNDKLLEKRLEKGNRGSNKNNQNGRYYEESVRIAEKSRKSHAEQDCQIM